MYQLGIEATFLEEAALSSLFLAHIFIACYKASTAHNLWSENQ